GDPNNQDLRGLIPPTVSRLELFVSFAADKKQETDVWPLSQEILVQLRQQSFGIRTGLHTDHGSWGLRTPLLDALNLAHSWSCQPFGRLEPLRPLGQLEGENLSPSKELLTEERDTETTSRNDSDRTLSQEAVEEQGLSPEPEAQPPAPALSEDEDSTPCFSLRTLLSHFALPKPDPSRSPHCIAAPAMPTLPEEEEGSEDQDRMQSSSASVFGADPRVSATPAIVLPDVTSSPDREFDQTTQIRSHSPIQRRSSRNSRTSMSSTSSLTSVGKILFSTEIFD
ncbi:hypothetical protein scyTo_0014428, partial [Scyliorhinus torazame]|nr:hypothetical protein [Scyliorhinus torazame]